ncbi:C40 family peptidase [Pontibacter sp. G13]|uniref:C40 family peptidase n=1 Tax=Pontibacter sp. G13 TaxID=3074898 RepID=UPI00288B2BAE|nr:C40 family peptidase [Pontibacter sp. G13]WNJ20973.1 C40 family peptidase [Pontibacter sp. G13]
MNNRTKIFLLGVVVLWGWMSCNSRKQQAQSESPRYVAPAPVRTPPSESDRWSNSSNTPEDTGIPASSDESAPEKMFGSLKWSQVEEVMQIAQGYIGSPYKYGGTTRAGFDCSGLMYTSFKQIGVDLPHQSAEIALMGTKVKKKDLEPGCLVFFKTTSANKITHVGLVVEGSGESARFVHSSTSKGVRIDQVDGYYWKDRFVKAVIL